MLIDDCEATNYYNQIIIERLDCTNTVVTAQGGPKALDYLKHSSLDGNQIPDLIFLDINMPGMNGWEFLEEYEKLSNLKQAKVVLLMLTTSLNPDDQLRASNIKNVKGFVNKPLEAEKLHELLAEYF